MAEQCYARLRDAILQGAYSPGERLTSVRLASDLGVSRTPIRAALQRLKADGLVDSDDNRAAWVRPLTVDEVEQAYEIAGALEGMLVKRLAAQISDADLRALDEAITQMESAATSGDQHAWVKGDETFHHLLSAQAGNPLLNSMLQRVETVINRVRFLSLNIRPEGAALSAQEHRRVYEALAAHDGQRARIAHENHLDRVRDENVAFLKASFGSFPTLPTPSRP
ncbi:GntR family transcriptional regulator [Bogoriella caseilytica]|uniref:GntR family transcriptional regulator n=1 Tax=Bogoriella caseilytica TaxID=56055 RepID=UPI0014738B7B|nr:GntR family transcriptional regulator [Bogoriella caseilytica]